MLDGRSFWAFPLETAGRQLPRLPVRCGEAPQLRPVARPGFCPKLGNSRLLRWDGTPRLPLVNNEYPGHGVQDRSCCMDVSIRMLILTFIPSKRWPGRLSN
jgi:hypothetical protein